MQRDTTTSNDEQTNEPDWVLASYGQRVGAWALDFMGFVLPLILLIVGLVAIFTGLLLVTHETAEGLETIDPTTGKVIIEERVTKSVTEFAGSEISDGTADKILIVLIVIGAALLVVFVGYIVWWLFALGRGQTPGKQIVGIRVIKDDGSPSGWGYTFLREFVIKFLLVGFLSDATLGIARLVDYLWPLWDRAEKMQTLHDKLLSTLVVRNPR